MNNIIFIENYFIHDNQVITDIPTNILNLDICNNDSLISELLIPQSLSSLKSLIIEDSCYKKVRKFVIDGLASLESVQIGEDCISISDDERNDGICRITNCPNLRQLKIGYQSIYDYISFELSNLNSIQSINFGRYCFVFFQLLNKE